MKTVLKFLVYAILGCISIVSCSEELSIKKKMIALMKSEVVIPTDLVCIKNGEQSVISVDSLKKNLLVIYYDSLNCSSCRIAHLEDNYPLFRMADTSMFSVLTVFSPRKADMEETLLRLSIAYDPYPVYVDVNHSFSTENKALSLDRRFNYVYLDSLNHPVVIGNPLANKKLYELFRKACNNNY